MSKIESNFGYQPFSKSEKNSSTTPNPSNRAFGDLLAGDEQLTGQFAGLINGEAEQQPAFEADAGQLDDGLGTILGNFESSPTADNDPGRNRTTPNRNHNRAKSRPVARRPEQPPTTPAEEARRAQLRYRGIGDPEQSPWEQQLGESPSPKLKDPLAPFAVPLQVDRFPMPNFLPIEKPTPTTVVRPEMLEQIVQEVRLGINETGAAEFQFDLKSDVLAGLKLKISTQDGQIQATFIAENVHIKDTLDQSAQELIQALQDRGLEVANLQVAVGSDAGSGNSSGNNSNARGGQSGFGNEHNEHSQSSASDYNYHSDPDQDTAADRHHNTRSTTDYTI